MPMDIEKHEEILNALNDPELSAVDRGELLGQLRSDYGAFTSEYQEMTETINKQDSAVKDLTLANSQLFRQIGANNRDPEKEKETQQQTFSETVTLEQLEGKM